MPLPRSSSIIRRDLRPADAFTLVEMLVVMGIIAALLAVILPAVRGLNNSASRHGAVGTLLGTLDRARMMAVTDGLATYVVFAVPTTTDGRSFKQELWGRAYAIYQDRDNISFVPEQRTPWVQLPQGMAFKVDASEFSTVTNRPVQPGSDPAFPVAAGALATSGNTSKVVLPYWKFDGTGGVDEQDPNYLRLLIFPGLLDAGGKEVSLQKADGVDGSKIKVLLEEIKMNSATGRAQYTINPYNNLATPTPAPST